MNTKTALNKLFSCYPHTEVSPATVATYVELLQDIPAEDLTAIVNQCISDCKFLPTIAEIRDRWHDMTRDPNRLTAIEAWGEVVQAFQKVGYVRIPDFSDGRITKIVNAMDWRTLCESTNQMADRAHFIKMFDALTERDERYAKLLPASRQLVERNRTELLPGTGIRFLVNKDDS